MTLLAGFLTGLSVGVYCLGICLPIFVPILLGFLTGINVCPPFLASLSYFFNLKSALLGTLYFLFFFLGTSVYIVPLALLGVFSQQTLFQKKLPEMLGFWWEDIFYLLA